MSRGCPVPKRASLSALRERSKKIIQNTLGFAVMRTNADDKTEGEFGGTGKGGKISLNFRRSGHD